MKIKNPSKTFLRFGLAFSFIYAAISSLINPSNWIGFIPEFLTKIISGNVLLTVSSIYELALGIWLISGKKEYFSAILASITLFLITVSNLGALDIIFRDIALLFASLALIFLCSDK